MPPLTEEHKQKLRERVFTDEWRNRISLAMTGRVTSEETKRKIADSMRGKKLRPETIEKMRIAHTKLSPKEGHQAGRRNQATRRWKKAVFERDDYTCQKYGTRGGDVNVHHIKNYAQYPELRTDMENGITLSVKAHREFHARYGIINNNRTQLDEFLKNNNDLLHAGTFGYVLDGDS